MEAELKGAQGELHTSLAKLDTAKEHIHGLGVSLDIAEAERDQHRLKCEEAQSGLEALEARIGTLQACHESASKIQTEMLNHEIQDLKERLAHQGRELEAVRAERNIAVAHISTLQRHINKAGGQPLNNSDSFLFAKTRDSTISHSQRAALPAHDPSDGAIQPTTSDTICSRIKRMSPETLRTLTAHV